ncbi:carbohydrate ABC transporter substrate-binding protein, CUT1 family /carbohydrate ABC transporter membrane protein 1, CUT1 family [Nannocystis exedens]|uniref:Carbohydrate ABC transporter substrate-binding protein, CUT1 family /carbohydrate ABC transporter membrane protein 1, CUT1 family n=1 Tax=Nannocystis exedens TaxID=54 RepID=A0A1I2GBH6_9BACT|nr:sugar ABC transporter permease [Nannocystis exedens]SFF14523.1 carbohydrate ABC transporter substrate-binding protein, CUT1 family /carbohydrate ABC transporter membrane protein 1, CUT1 family [Nannocystis exedens]
MLRRAAARLSARAGARVFGALFALLAALAPALARAGELRLWHAYRDAEAAALVAIVEEFSARTGHRVELLAVAHESFGSKLAATIPRGQGPHVFIDSHERLGDYRQRALVGDAGPALEPDAVYTAQSLAAVTQDGARWGVPLSAKSVALFVNASLVDRVPGTLEDIAALKLPAGVYPLAYEAQSAYGHMPLLAAFGGRMLEGDARFGFVGPAAARSLAFAKELVDRGAVPRDADGALVSDLFRSGRAAFAISGPWLVGQLAGVEFPWRVVPLPKVGETGLPMRPPLTVEAAMLSPQGAASPAALALARALGSAEAAALRQRLAGTLSVRTDVPVPEDNPVLAGFRAQAELAEPMSADPAMRSTWEPAFRAIRKVLRGQAGPDDALAEAARRFADVRRPPPAAASPTPALLVLGLGMLLVAFHLVRRARDPEARRALRASLPAYRYVAHSVVVVGLLVFVPLIVGAATSLFAGRPGEGYYVGLANFVEILTARGGPLLATGSFWFVLLVTFLWTAVNVVLHLGIGLALGLVLSRPTLRLRALYRVLLILPWAVPSYVTALAWKGMFHQQFGAVTGLIHAVNDWFGTSIEPIAWFSRFATAFAANVATNVWLGFPFMMVVTLGALTAVPADVLEAAEVDGATRWQRLTRVTLPMIRPALAPAVTLGAIWTFNMFNVVFLVSGGDPDGSTDILVSEAYRWAFTREAQYGYAAAYAVLIFLLLLVTTRLPAWLARKEAGR